MQKLLFLIVMALGGSLLASACGGDGEEGITIEDFTGRWVQLSTGVYNQFNEDGTFRVAVGSVANLEDDPTDLGEFRLEGTLITFITSDESPNCAGQSGTYQVELTEEGHLQFTLEEDPCRLRASSTMGAPSGPLRRISP